MDFLLNVYIVFSLFTMIIGGTVETNSAAKLDALGRDGEVFVRNIINGDKLSKMPGHLLFTAPYRLCKGGCNDSDSESEHNFVLAFPLYIGNKGKDRYKKIYHRDFKKFHSTKPYAPFKKRTTIRPFTMCPSQKSTTTTTTEEPTTTEVPTTTEIPTPTEWPTTTDIPPTETPTSTEIPTTTGTSTETETPTELSTASETPTPTELPTTSELPTTTEPTTTELSTTTDIPTTTGLPTTTEFSTITEFHTATETLSEPQTVEYEPYTTEPTTAISYLTNAAGVRCPPLNPKNCRKRWKGLLPHIVSLEVHSSIYKDSVEKYKNPGSHELSDDIIY